MEQPSSRPEATKLLKPSLHYGFLGINEASQDFWASPRYISTALVALAPLGILFGCWLDQTLIRNDGGKGLSNHYGFWIIFISSPLLILLSGHLLDSFCSTIKNYRTFFKPNVSRCDTADFDKLISAEFASLCLKSKSRYVLYFGVLVGLYYYLINVVETHWPYRTYGHDVFDSWGHAAGYWFTKLYLLPIFLWVYPVAIFIAAHTTYSMIKTIRFSLNRDMMEVNFFDRDRCGGMSRFGYLNMLVMVIYFLLLLVIVGMLMTHERTYFVTRSAMVFCSIAMIIQSVGGVYSIHRLILIKKQEKLEQISEILTRSARESIRLNRPFNGDLLALQSHIMAVHTYPYADKARYAVNVIRYAPAVLALASFFLP